MLRLTRTKPILADATILGDETRATILLKRNGCMVEFTVSGRDAKSLAEWVAETAGEPVE